MGKTLKERAQEMTAILPFMQGREKGESADLLDTIQTIRDYGFITDRKSGDEYAAFIVDDEPGKFFFGGMVLTNHLRTMEADGYHAEIVADGLPVLMSTKKAKDSGREYTSVEFYPAD